MQGLVQAIKDNLKIGGLTSPSLEQRLYVIYIFK